MTFKTLEDIQIDNKPIVMTIKTIVRYLDSLNTNTEKRVLEVFDLSSLLQYSYNAYDYRNDMHRDFEVHDLYKLINIYGYGLCKQATLLMGAILDYIGIENRVLYLGRRFENEFDHFAIEVFYDESWHYYDPDLHFYFLNEQGKVASAEELAKNPYSKVIGDFSAKRWLDMDFENFKKLSDLELFRDSYMKMFQLVEIFYLNDDRFEYKKTLMENRGIVKWYNYNQKELLINDDVEITIDYQGDGIVQSKRVQSTDYISFKNLIFNYTYNSEYLNVNDFPFLVLDLSLFFDSNKAVITIVLNGEKYDCKIKSGEPLFEQLLKSFDIYTKPIYSFEVISNESIRTYEVRVQSSNLVDRLYERMGE